VGINLFEEYGLTKRRKAAGREAILGDSELSDSPNSTHIETEDTI